MLPVGYLMIEHRLIERMIALMKKEIERMKREKKGDPALVDQAIDFIKTYADKCHHGKEEDILFKSLSSKSLSAEHKKMMQGLIEDHAYGRRTVKGLEVAQERYFRGDKAALGAVAGYLGELVAFYPKHIEKEDKHFFLPVMAYLNKEEQDGILEAFYEFDRKMVHETYREMVKQLEKGA